MSRFAAFLLVFCLVIPGYAQMFSHGAPASVVSPEPDGRQHGVPASVVSPAPLPPGVHPPFVFHGPVHRFGDRHRRQVFVPVPLFFPVYGYDGSYPVADPYVQAPSDPQANNAANNDQDQRVAADSEDALRDAYLQGARDALKQQRDDLRYGSHYMDSRERASANSESSNDAPPVHSSRPSETPSGSSTSAPRKDDNGPATVFIFKDGHQIETHNFAIMGQTLYDFSASTLKKVELADLDKDKTIKANDDRGLTVKLP